MLPHLRSCEQFHPLKSQCMYLWHLVAITSISMLFYKLPSQEYTVKMYTVTQGHARGSRCTPTSTQPFSHMCWGHDAHEQSVRKSENTFSKETNPINQMQLSYWNPLFKGVQTPSGVWEQGKFPCVRLLNTKLNFSVWDCYVGLLCARQPMAFHFERQEMLCSGGLGKLFWLPHVALWPKSIWNYSVKEWVHF